MKTLENRFYPPLVGLVFAAIMLVFIWAMGDLTFPSPIQIALASTLFSIGIIVATLAVKSFHRAKTTLHPIKIGEASSLVTSGVFALTRNPMYLGMALALLAWATFLGGFWAMLGPIAFVAYITRFQIIPEERALIELFDQSFEDYRQKVRRWIYARFGPERKHLRNMLATVILCLGYVPILPS